MSAPNTPEPQPEQPHAEAAQHVAEAHTLLQSLRDRLAHHPELDNAIVKLELALSVLTTKTGGIL